MSPQLRMDNLHTCDVNGQLTREDPTAPKYLRTVRDSFPVLRGHLLVKLETESQIIYYGLLRFYFLLHIEYCQASHYPYPDMSQDDIWRAQEDGGFSEEGFNVTDSRSFTIPLESQGQPGG